MLNVSNDGKEELRNRVLGELLFEQLAEKESPASLLVEDLTHQFILGNLIFVDGERFLELLKEEEQDRALAFARERIADFDRKLANYLETHFEKLMEVVLRK